MKAKIIAVVEVCVVFSLTAVLFQVVHATPLAAEINRFFGEFLFVEYAVLLILAAAAYRLRDHSRAPTSFKQKWRDQLTIVGRYFWPIFVLSVLLSWIDWTQWRGALLITLAEIGLLAWVIRIVKNGRPSGGTVGPLSGLLLLTATQISGRLAGVATAVVYFYLFVGPGEETLFRGYIQARLNAVFGRPYSLLGVSWGWGIIVSAVLFGLWHLGWQADGWAWPHVLWTIAAGLLFGLIREKSDSVIAPAVLHGVMNYGPQAILFYLFWG